MFIKVLQRQITVVRKILPWTDNAVLHNVKRVVLTDTYIKG